jgi:hypothetical protein
MDKGGKSLDGNKGRMQPVHMMESYTDPLGLRVELDFSLQFVDTRRPDIKMGLDRTKERLIGWLEKYLKNHPSIKRSLDPMRKSEGNAYTQAVSGKRLDFRVAGQNIPNRGFIRYDNGSKVFVDMKTRLLQWPGIKKTVEAVFGAEQTSRIYDNDDNIISIGVKAATGGHEFSHSALEGPNTREKLGPHLYNELWKIKSNVIPAAAMNALLDPEERADYIKSILATSLRSLSQRDNETQRPYYNSAVVIINELARASIIRIVNEKWTIVINEKTMDDFRKGSEGIFCELLEIYDTENPEVDHEFLQTYVTEAELSKPIVELLKKLGVKTDFS